jgi:hypothetical protein
MPENFNDIFRNSSLENSDHMYKSIGPSSAEQVFSKAAKMTKEVSAGFWYRKAPCE